MRKITSQIIISDDYNANELTICECILFFCLHTFNNKKMFTIARNSSASNWAIDVDFIFGNFKNRKQSTENCIFEKIAWLSASLPTCNPDLCYLFIAFVRHRLQNLWPHFVCTGPRIGHSHIGHIYSLGTFETNS